MMVSANSAICVSAEPTVAGPKRLRKSFTSASNFGQRNRRQHALPRRIGADQQRFEHAGDQHAPGRGVAGGREEDGEGERRDHREIEQDRRGGSRGEALQRVEDAAVERHQADQQEIGKGDAGELDREREAAGVLVEAGREQPMTVGVKMSATASSTSWRREQQREDAVGEQPRRIGAALRADARIGRHEGRVERAFGEDRAEMIGQPQRDEEGVRHRPGAEHRGKHDVAHEAGDARDQRPSADREDALDHPRSFSIPALHRFKRPWAGRHP